MGCDVSKDKELLRTNNLSHLVEKIDLNESTSFKSPLVYFKKHVDWESWLYCYPTDFADPPALGDYNTQPDWGGRLPVDVVTLRVPNAEPPADQETNKMDDPLIELSTLMEWMELIADMDDPEEVKKIETNFAADAFKKEGLITLSQAASLLLERALQQFAEHGTGRKKKKTAARGDEDSLLDVATKRKVVKKAPPPLPGATDIPDGPLKEIYEAEAAKAALETKKKREKVYFRGPSTMRRLFKTLLSAAMDTLYCVEHIYVVAVIQPDFSFFRDYLMETMLTLGVGEHYHLVRKLMGTAGVEEELRTKVYYRFQPWLAKRLTIPLGHKRKLPCYKAAQASAKQWQKAVYIAWVKAS